MSAIRELAERTGVDRSEVSELLESLKERGWVKVLRSDGAVNIHWGLTDEGRRILPPGIPDGYASVGGHEAQVIAVAAREFYLSKGWFFALARQDSDMPRRVDCVACDYDSGRAVAVEIESSGHVIRDHAEQVKKHMLEVSPFDEVHFWAFEVAAERIMELRSEIRPEDQDRVKVFRVTKDSLA
ncbi:MAG TPA: helix-turn-helix domain-containing protein [Nitrososphaerales archaeon]|nr:helix-turn-helix domain-containing protein [Nitrososphaerales archaeon]